jgi:phthiocerol/phenolphthiocerol synthesis type-I polyketide synthase D
MNFGLMFFASSEDALSGTKYRVVLESARFADRNGFSSVWVPERHFTKFGSLYPNPAVLHSALAMATNRIRLNAGSVVVPLHNPIRIAEEWAMVDNLSGGRVGVSFASGWNPEDFAFFPERYQNRQEIMLEGIRAVQRLWRGETTKATSGNGDEIAIRIYPSPVQPELPVWLTAAGNPKTYMLAGELGANLLTHLLDQDEEQLASKIALYRQARAEHGWDPSAGIVTVMLHTFVGADVGLVREQARAPFCQYIKSNIGLLKGLSQSRGQNIDISSMPERDLNEFVNFLYDRFAAGRGLIGTPESCFPLMERLDRIGVNEVASLLDFGPETELILTNLPHLSRLKDLCRTRLASVEKSTSREQAGQRFTAESVQARCTVELSGAEFNEQLRAYGIEIDGEFKAVERIWRRDGEALGRIQLPPDGSKSASAFTIHPAFLDACSRVLAAALPEEIRRGLYLPAKIRSLRISGVIPVAGWSHAVVKLPDEGVRQKIFEGDVDIYNFEGRLMVRIEGLRLERPLLGGEAVEESAPQNESLIYRRGWIVRPSSGARETPIGKWMIFADRSGVGARLAALLKGAGADCILVSPEECDAADREAIRTLIARESPQRIVHLWSLDAVPPGETTIESLPRDQELICASALHLIQAASHESAGSTPRVCFVTKGAMAVRDQEAVAVAQAPLWGFARVMAIEHPKLWGGIVDMDSESPASEDSRHLFEWLLEPDGEDMAAFRVGHRYVARLQADESVKVAATNVRFDKTATYLITGALGGLGLEVARWMVQAGARNLALLSRSEPSADAMKAIEQFEHDDACVRAFRADVSRIDELSGVISAIESTMPPLKGVLHLAGVLDDAMLAGQTWQRFRTAGLAKVEGGWNLHQLTERAPLDFFVLFSSMASLVTMPGQGSYAAANVFLDALAHYRRSLGRPALSINWGPWGEIGHAATPYGRDAHARLAVLGINAIAPQLGLQLLGTLMGQSKTQVGVGRVNWGKLFQADAAAALSPLLSEQVRNATTFVTRAQEEPELLKKLRELPPSERHEALTAFLSELLGKALKLKNRELLAPRQGLFELGLDSIIALQLKSQLELSLGQPFPATLFFTHPTIESLAEYLSSDLRLSEAETQSQTAALETPEAESESTGESTSTDSLSEEEIAQLITQEIGYGKEIVSAAGKPQDHTGRR